MKIAYICGFGSKLNENKINILNKFGEVIYFDPNYLKSKDIMYTISKELDNVMEKDDVLIVGSSLGAYMAFHVSNLLKIPALLFNPTFHFKNGGVLTSNASQKRSDKMIILSKQDEILDNKMNSKFLMSMGCECEEIESGHHISLEDFENCFKKFYAKFGEMKNKKPQRKSIKNDWDIYDTTITIPRNR